MLSGVRVSNSSRITAGGTVGELSWLIQYPRFSREGCAATHSPSIAWISRRHFLQARYTPPFASRCSESGQASSRHVHALHASQRMCHVR